MTLYQYNKNNLYYYYQSEPTQSEKEESTFSSPQILPSETQSSENLANKDRFELIRSGKSVGLGLFVEFQSVDKSQ